MRINQLINKYFTFNRRERNGLIILLCLIFALILSNQYFKSRITPVKISITPLASANMDGAQEDGRNELKEDLPGAAMSGTQKSNSGLFEFDPNLITEEQALQLGFRKKLVQTLLNFRSRGGKFKTKEDLKKVYGMSDAFYLKLEPFIRITVKPATADSGSRFSRVTTAPVPFTCEINSCDSLSFVKLNGIGPVLAQRIIRLRSALGGFSHKEQLKEVYGMRDSLFNLFRENIRVDVSLVKKINVNIASIEEMKKHPYIKFMIAQSIFNYRAKHGKYAVPEDLLKVGSISEEALRKLSPYLEF